MDPNPYEPSAIPIPLDSAPSRTANDAGHDLLRAWEYRRLWFNAILIVEFIYIGAFSGALIFKGWFWARVIEVAITVNFCFCVGPVATWYLSRLGFDDRLVGPLLFWAGTVLTILVVLFQF